MQVLLDLHPEELAGVLLVLLVRHGRESGLHTGNMLGELWGDPSRGIHGYPRERDKEIEQALAEAWHWLEQHGLVIPDSGQNGKSGYRRLSRRARKVTTPAEFDSFKRAHLLPRDLLHPGIRAKAWSAFVRGEYDSAVLQAMKAVEVAVRIAAGYSNSDHGTDMFMRAFHVDNGPLRDSNAQKSEREAIRNLFAGAYGTYRNPVAHRDVNLDEPTVAVEIILLASHLLRIIEHRRPLMGPSGAP